MTEVDTNDVSSSFSAAAVGVVEGSGLASTIILSFSSSSTSTVGNVAGDKSQVAVGRGGGDSVGGRLIILETQTDVSSVSSSSSSSPSGSSSLSAATSSVTYKKSN